MRFSRTSLLLLLFAGMATKWACATPDHGGAVGRSRRGAGGSSCVATRDGGAGVPASIGGQAAASEAGEAGAFAGGSGGALAGFVDAGIDITFSVDAEPHPDTTCLSVTQSTAPLSAPVDIVWVVDNSVSMQPAIDELTQGLDDFAELIASAGIDYRVIMLSLRSMQPQVTRLGGVRYAVCIPPPLAGDSSCGNGPRFFHSSVDIRSHQPLEQILGTLGQTTGYRQGDDRGGEPWRGWLRAEAKRAFVIVTDDDSRLSADDFDHFAGGTNPWNSNELPPGLLEPFWNGLFNGYTFSAIYGWGSELDATVRCEYTSGVLPPSAGLTYTELVSRTGGVRAKICAGAAAWAPFFDAIAQAVVEHAVLACEVALPTAQAAMLGARTAKITIEMPSGTAELHKVGGPAGCGTSPGWHYDDETRPSLVVLCPTSCELARSEALLGEVRIQVVSSCVELVK